MILKLRNKKIIIEQNNVPENVNNVHIQYDFELGTNHLYPRLIVNNTDIFEGDHIDVNLDYAGPSINLVVELYDAHNILMRRYVCVRKYHKTCTLGDTKHIDIYKELERVYKELKELKEKGEVI